MPPKMRQECGDLDPLGCQQKQRETVWRPKFAKICDKKMGMSLPPKSLQNQEEKPIIII